MTEADDAPAGFVPRGKYERDIAQLRQRLSKLERQLSGNGGDADAVESPYDPQYEQPVIDALADGATGSITELVDLVTAETSISNQKTAKKRAKKILRDYPCFEMGKPGKWRYTE